MRQVQEREEAPQNRRNIKEIEAFTTIFTWLVPVFFGYFLAVKF
jgi:hypothetical protein